MKRVLLLPTTERKETRTPNKAEEERVAVDSKWRSVGEKVADFITVLFSFSLSPDTFHFV